MEVRELDGSQIQGLPFPVFKTRTFRSPKPDIPLSHLQVRFLQRQSPWHNLQGQVFKDKMEVRELKNSQIHGSPILCTPQTFNSFGI